MAFPNDLPRMMPRTVVATFADDATAEVAIRALLTAGFENTQISLIPANAQNLTPANDPSPYRATGLGYSPSRQDRAHAPQISERESADSESSKYSVVMVQPNREIESGMIKELLTEAGGRIAQHLDTEAA